LSAKPVLFFSGRLDRLANFLLNMPHELGVGFHSYFANRAARHNYTVPTLGDAWRIFHECIKLMPLEFGPNGCDDVTSSSHETQASMFALSSPRAGG
jgi:hypothetical protein